MQVRCRLYLYWSFCYFPMTLDTRDFACFADANGHCPLDSITNVETDRTIAKCMCGYTSTKHFHIVRYLYAFERSDVCGERRDLKCWCGCNYKHKSHAQNASHCEVGLCV